MIIPSEEEIIFINKKLGYNTINIGNIEFLTSKLRSMRLGEDEKRNIAKVAGNLWFSLVSLHPFSDGNKRTATEVVRYFLELNNYRLEMPSNGIIYISLKIANGDITLNNLIDIIHSKLVKVK